MKLFEKESRIKSFVKTNNFEYVPLNELEINQVYDFMFNDIVQNVNLSNVFLYYGVYFQILGDFKNMKKYYFKAIKKENSYAMNNLGCYFKKQSDFKNMKKYYFKAIEKGNVVAMRNLGIYYEIQKDYSNMIKYYLMAIRGGDLEIAKKLQTEYSEQKYEYLLKYFTENIEQKEKINNLEIYIAEQEYRPGEVGFIKAQRHFESLIK
jgi:TPR repeat protein